MSNRSRHPQRLLARRCVSEISPVTEVFWGYGHYGGAVLPRRVKNRGYYDVDLAQIQLNPERSVFPVELLKQVGSVVKVRSVRPVNKGVRINTEPYPLAGVIYCAHCEALAQATSDPKRRTRLGGFTSNGRPRYRHREGRKCGATNRSVLTQVVEDDFCRFLEILGVRDDAMKLMLDYATVHERESGNREVDIERQKRDGIALCKRRIEAAVTLYGDARISKEEYQRRIEANESEIEHWQAQTTNAQEIAIELVLVVNTLQKLASSWKTANSHSRQSLVRVLFEEIIYDLDSHRIVDFKLKPWAAQFLTLRVAIHSMTSENAEEKPSAPSFQEVYPDVTPTGLLIRPIPALESSSEFILRWLYTTTEPTEPVNALKPTQTERNARIRELYATGYTLEQIARQYGISKARVWELVRQP